MYKYERGMLIHTPSYNKKNKILSKKVNSSDAESIFDMIDQQNPLGEKND